MARKISVSSVPGKLRAESVKHIPDSKIDFSDIPESSVSELRRARRVGRPVSGKAKQLIAFRIAPGLLKDLRKIAKKRKKPYQTLLHDLLEQAIRSERQ